MIDLKGLLIDVFVDSDFYHCIGAEIFIIKGELNCVLL